MSALAKFTSSRPNHKPDALHRRVPTDYSKGALQVVSCLERVNLAVREYGGYLRADLLFLLTSNGYRVEIYFVPH